MAGSVHRYLKLYLYDSKQEDLGCLFYEAIAFINQAKNSGGRCFVHCHQGVSRSCTVCIAYLLQSEGITYDMGFSKVKAARAICNPNAAFICQLMEFHKRLHSQERPRGFRVVWHSANHPDSSFCARSVEPGGPNIGPLKRDECVVVYTADCVYLWIGENADEAAVSAAQSHVTRVQENESAPMRCETISSGSEPREFWIAAKQCGFTVSGSTALAQDPPPEVTQRERDDARMAAEDEGMRIGNRGYGVNHGGMTERRLTPPEPTGFELLRAQLPPDENPEPMSQRRIESVQAPMPVKVDSEDEGKLFTYPDWQELEMFDSDDLVSDMAVVLLPNKKPVACIYVWLGCEFLELEGGNKGQDVAREFIAFRGLPATVEVIMEQEQNESEPFWDFFVNG